MRERGPVRLMLAGTLATLTAASLAINPARAPDRGGARAARGIQESRWRADVRFLSSDLLEGRAPGTRGEQLAREYIAARFEAIGLEPGAPGGSWEQPVELVGVARTRRPSCACARGADARAAALGRLHRLEQPAPSPRRESTTPRSSSSATASWPPSTVGRLQGRRPARQGAADDEQRPGGRPGAVRRQDAASTTAAGTTSTRWRPRRAPPARSSSTRRPPPATPGRSCRPPGRGEQLQPARDGRARAAGSRPG